MRALPLAALPDTAARPLPGPRAALAWLVRRVDLARQRRALSRLDARLLRDVGIPPEAAGREAARPAWDVPRHWRD